MFLLSILMYDNLFKSIFISKQVLYILNKNINDLYNLCQLYAKYNTFVSVHIIHIYLYIQNTYNYIFLRMIF